MIGSRQEHDASVADDGIEQRLKCDWFPSAAAEQAPLQEEHSRSPIGGYRKRQAAEKAREEARKQEAEKARKEARMDAHAVEKRRKRSRSPTAWRFRKRKAEREEARMARAAEQPTQVPLAPHPSLS